jgi:hypothetical protein
MCQGFGRDEPKEGVRRLQTRIIYKERERQIVGLLQLARDRTKEITRMRIIEAK